MKKTETKSTVLLQHHLKTLKLPTILAEHEKIAARCAADNVDHLGFLLQLCELELIERERRAADRRLKSACFPTHKTLDSFDFKAQPSLNKVLITELMRGEYIDQRENILLVGNSGTGKPRPSQYPSGYGDVRGGDSGHRSVSSAVWTDFSAVGTGSAARFSAALPGRGVSRRSHLSRCASDQPE